MRRSKRAAAPNRSLSRLVEIASRRLANVPGNVFALAHWDRGGDGHLDFYPKVDPRRGAWTRRYLAGRPVGAFSWIPGSFLHPWVKR